MRIGFDAKRAFFNKSGLGSYSRNLIQGLARKYPENDYVLYTPGLNYDLFDPTQECISIKGPERIHHRLFRFYWRSFYLSHQLAKDKIEIFHGLSHEIPYNFPRKQVKSVVTIHDLIFLRLPHLYRAFDRAIYTNKFRYACETSHRIIAVSKQTAKDVVEFFNIPPEKIDVVYQGCNPVFNNQAPLIEKEILRMKYLLPKSFILYVGTIEERKNLLTLIKALHYGKIDMPLVVIGKPTPYLNKVIEFIERHSLINIIFCDIVQNQDLPGIYQLADLFVYPSIFEGFGIPILEALYSKVPVITSIGSCFAEAGGEHTIYVDPNNVEEMAAAIKKVLFDSELQEKMEIEGYRYSRKFDDDKVSANIMQVYQKVLEHE
ncbi:MAG TPA: glycosyltransferase family 1 protein [Bacteroidales bacterium]|nr:glycosyltransferase family 1 protein [Bacteroidales bacterium]